MLTGNIPNNNYLPCNNDLPNCFSHSQSRMFVDDTHLTITDNNIYIILNKYNPNADLAKIRELLTVNKLTLNTFKIKLMVIGSCHQDRD